MKTLILYNSKTGDIISTQSPVEDDYTCNYLIVDVPEDRVEARVEDGEVINGDIYIKR